MTKWQESCITALASSPMAWEAFKMKQRNKKLLWQYINRIWPYKLITGTKVNKNKKDLPVCSSENQSEILRRKSKNSCPNNKRSSLVICAFRIGYLKDLI